MPTPSTTPTSAPSRGGGSPSLAALLSFILPGLGQVYTRRWRAAILFAVPALVVAAIAVIQAQDGIDIMFLRLVDPTIAAAVFVALVVFGIWRLVAVLHAYGSAGARTASRSGERFSVALLLVAIVATHGLGAWYVQSVYAMDLGIFQPGGDGAEAAQLPASGSRVTILLAGVDQYSTRSESLYDSIMVVSIDTDTRHVTMISLPRDTAGFPYYWGGTSKIKINAIPTYVRNGWIKSGDNPVTTLVKEVSYLVGVPINYYGALDLASFMRLIDMIGGVDITASAVNDPSYDWLDGSPYGFQIAAGPHHLNGRLALAYARSRHGAGNSDYARAARQQQVLSAVAHKIATPAMFGQLHDLMGQAASLVQTNFPASQVADTVKFAQSVPAANWDNYVLGPPYSVSSATATASTSCLQLDKVAVLSVKLFGTDSRYSGKNQPPTC
jgi:polyisoprenyl-teichoic acid--peptidoglycan teichoic acid transferase